MKHLRMTRWAVASRVGTLIALTMVLASAGNAQVTYTVTDLGTLFAGGNTFPASLNNRGQVVGAAFLPFPAFGSTGFMWIDGTMSPLPALGGLFSFALGVNASGQAAGGANLPGDTVTHASLWEDGEAIGLGTLGGSNSNATSINNEHEIAGLAQTKIMSATGAPATHAFLWQKGIMLDLNTLGGDNSMAFAVNEAGRVTGQSDVSTEMDPTFGIPPFRGFAWHRGVLTDLQEIFGGKFNYGQTINNLGQIAGSADLSGDQTAHAFIWQNGLVKDLGTLPEDAASAAFGINNSEQAVGISSLANNDPSFGPPVNVFLCPCHAVLWDHGKIIDLNTVTPPNIGLELLAAFAINDRGQIVAQGTRDFSVIHALLLTPQPGPGAPTSAAGPTSANSTGSALTGPISRPGGAISGSMRIILDREKGRVRLDRR
jgi:probable HAF family extracellular repeat protein